MNEEGIHSVLDARLISVPTAPSQRAQRATGEGAAGGARAPDPEVDELGYLTIDKVGTDLDRLLHHAETIVIEAPSYRSKGNAETSA